MTWGADSDENATLTDDELGVQVSNAVGWDQSQWASEMSLAITASIDAFALNIAAGSSANAEQLPIAFAAAVQTNFKLFFSSDYAGNASWAKSDVLSTLDPYIHSTAYFQHTTAHSLLSRPLKAPAVLRPGSRSRGRPVASSFRIGRPKVLGLPWHLL